jgi:hypothetical protein
MAANMGQTWSNVLCAKGCGGSGKAVVWMLSKKMSNAVLRCRWLFTLKG